LFSSSFNKEGIFTVVWRLLLLIDSARGKSVPML
jgi:hypothetical protein